MRPTPSPNGVRSASCDHKYIVAYLFCFVNSKVIKLPITQTGKDNFIDTILQHIILIVNESKKLY